MAAQRRRLAQDHAALRAAPPSDYFFPVDGSNDDLTGLSIYLTGPASTPFEAGVFHISLRIPVAYPHEPPKANFHTKIFHPNIDDRTGDVCVDTLKRDWNPKLTLHDVLVTIRCLLVYPNPTSSLNEAAGKLLLEDYEGFAKHAKLMTEVHAPVPVELKGLVQDTRNRKVDDEEVEEPNKTLASGGNGIAAPKSTPFSKNRHKRQPSKPSTKASSTTVIRKNSQVTTTVPVRPTTGADSDSDSGKENILRRPISPTGIKRSRNEDLLVVPPEENEKGELSKDTSESSGRKSPKLKEDSKIGASPQKDTSAKPRTIFTTKKATNMANKKKTAAKMGLKRF